MRTKGLLSRFVVPVFLLVGSFYFLSAMALPAQSSEFTVRETMLRQLNELTYRLALIEKFIGKPAPAPNLLILKNVSLREVYFAAENLYERANRFCFEITGNYVEVPGNDVSRIRYQNILEIIDEAMKRISEAEEKLGIKEKRFQPKLNQAVVTEEEIFKKIMIANRQLGNLLYQKTTPGDVYAQVYAANAALKAFVQKVGGKIYESGNAVEIVGYKRPGDVYLLLQECMKQLDELTKKLGLNIASFDEKKFSVNPSDVAPDQVIDLAKLILSESSYLKILVKVGGNSVVRHFGYKTPSQVYRQGELFINQIHLIASELDKYRDYISKIKGHPHDQSK